MTIESHVEEFGGLRVRDYVPAKGIVAPTTTAYRIALDYDELEAGANIVDLLGQLLDDPRAAQLSKLVVGLWGHSEATSEAIVEMLVSARDKLPGLTGLFIGDIIRSEQEISWIRHGDLSPIWGAFPGLLDFKVRGDGGLRLGRISHPALQSLVLEAGGLRPQVIREVAQASLPELRHLELWMGSEWYGGTATLDDLRPYLAGDLFPRLKSLALRNFKYADELAQAIVQSPVLDRIETLDLSLGTLGDEGAQALLDSPRIKRLKKLDLHYHFMSIEMMDSLKKLPLEVDVSERQEPRDGGDEGDQRYVAITE